ncbi:MAG: DUF3667 domain-containing protein [Bacteroidota bacterium]
MIQTPAIPRCFNCGEVLKGPFCHACGQEAVDRPLSLRTFLANALDQLFSFRSKTLRSLVYLIIKPGTLTRQYISGQRVRYANPIQIYAICAAVFFLANSYRSFVTITEKNQVVSSLSAMKLGQGLDEVELGELMATGITPEVFRERFRMSVTQSLPQFMIGGIVAFALAVWLFNPRRPFMIHVIFALHWIGFFMLVMSFDRFLPSAETGQSPITGIIVIGTLVHLTLSLRAVYDHGWFRAAISGLGLFVAFNTILVVWVFSVVEFAFWLML